MPLVLELEHRGGDRDAALLLQLHPVAGGVAAGAARLDAPGQVDGSSIEEQLLGERRLAGVGMTNDGEGAPAGDFALELRGHG